MFNFCDDFGRTDADFQFFLDFFQIYRALQNRFFNVFIRDIQLCVNHPRAIYNYFTVLADFSEIIIGSFLERFVRQNRTVDFAIWQPAQSLHHVLRSDF